MSSRLKSHITKKMKRLLIIALLSIVSTTQAQSEKFDQVLKTYVDSKGNVNYQGLKSLTNEESNHINLKLVQQGSLNEKEYDLMVLDLVNFLSYVGEPHQVERRRLGVFVILFLSVFLVITYLMKREYWKDVK